MTDTTIAAGDTVIKDSGARRVFASGAQRDRAIGKGAFALLPYQALLEIAQIFEAGGIKYTPNNWKLGMPLSEYANSGIRHALKAAAGWDDENHAAQAAWNFMCLIETRHMIRQGFLSPELNDIDNWLTTDGVKAAMESVKAENEKRLAERDVESKKASIPCK